MREESSGGCASSSPSSVLKDADAQGYRSASGEFNYYPTSAHKRLLQIKSGNGEGFFSSAVSQDGHARGSPSPGTAQYRAVSPSSAGLSRSPSLQAPSRQSAVVRRSASLPLSLTSAECSANPQPSNVLVTSKGGAPLLHRYRTSQVWPQRRATPRSTSSPARSSQLPLSAANKNQAITSFGSQRSLLKPLTSVRRKRSPSSVAAATPAHPSTLEPAPQIETELAKRKAASTDSALRQTKLSKPSGAEVPVAHVRLEEPEHTASDAVRLRVRSIGAVNLKQERVRAGQQQLHAPGAESAVCQTQKAEVAQSRGVTEAQMWSVAPPLLDSQVANELQSRGNIAKTFVCPENSCMHSQKSICEFVLMQRELRRCYATMEGDEEVIAQLRHECADAWAAHHQLQRQCIQREREVETAVRAELMGQIRALQQAQGASVGHTAEKAERKIADSSDGDLDRDLHSCVETTLQETLCELQRVFQEERAAHALSRQQLDEARSAASYWKSHAAEMQERRSSVCRQMNASSLGSAIVAHQHTSDTSDHSTRVSPSPKPSGAVSDNSRNLSPPSASPSSAPHPVSPPRPHQPLSSLHTRKTADANEGVADLSLLSALTKESSSVVEAEVSTMEEAAKATEVRTLDASDASTPSRDAFAAGATTEAVGSGAVVVESQWVKKQAEKRIPVSDPAALKQPSTPSSSLDTSAHAALAVMKNECEGESGDDQVIPSPGVHYQPHFKHVTITAQPLSGASAPEQRSTVPLRHVKHTAGEQEVLLAFPPPSFAKATKGAWACHIDVSPLLAKEAVETNVSMVLSAERRCKELLSALLDKERQLAEVAEERTKYKLLYEKQSRVTL